MSDTIVVNEIFTSIQGESTRAGLPCTFVRLTGCDLRCAYCDTEYAFTEGTARSVEEVAADVERRGVRFVTVTGGEPLLQPKVHALVRALLDRGFDVQVETSGAIDISPLDPRARAILDVKTPGSGMGGRMDWANLGRIRPGDEIKFVLTGREDYLFARDFLLSGRIAGGTPVLLSPAHGLLDPKDLAAWMVEDRLAARLQVQLHKVVWGAEARGV